MEMYPLKFNKSIIVLLLLSLGVITACEEDDENLPVLPEDQELGIPNSLYNVAENNSDLSIFLEAVNRAGLTLALREDAGEKTVFAPSNSAFQAAGIDLGSIDRQDLLNILNYHVIAGTVGSADITDGRVETLSGKLLEVSTSGGVTLDPNGDNASVVNPDITGANGVIHIIDKVLTPQPTLLEVVQGNSNLSILGQALGRFDGLVGAAGDEASFLTVFAPTNTAFENLLAALPEYSSLDDIPDHVLETILQYHIASGKALSTGLGGQTVGTLQGENIVADDVLPSVAIADVNASNGVAHVVNEVLIPPMAIGEVVATNSIYRALTLDPAARFTTLVSAIDNAGLRSTLLEAGTFTLFAPTNDALSAAGLGAGDLSEAVLLYHVLGTQVASGDITAGPVTTLATGLETSEVFIRLDNGAPLLNAAANVVEADITTENGIVHAIDFPLIPPMNIVDIASGNDSFSELVAALVKAELDDDVRSLDDITVFAPTNAAFQALYDDLGVSGLDDLTKADLEPILLHHVFDGARVFSIDLAEGENEITTMNQGFSLFKDVDGDNTTAIIDQEGPDANLTGFDILGSNGVIHVVDKVLIP